MSWASAVRQAPAKTKAKAIVSSFMPATFKPAPIDWGRLVSLDFETYYDVGYTLSTLSTSSYVRDPRFEALMVGIKIGRGKTKVVPRDKIAAELKKINWGTHSLLCHNVQFDGFIMSERYGVTPKQYYCTLSMARALHSNEVGAGLHDVSMFYGGAGKLEGGVENMKGKSFDTLWADKPLWSASAAYCVNDVDEMFRIFQEMHDKMPPNELQLVHMTARMFCAPVLRIDIPRVEAEYVREVESREKLLLGMLDPRKYDDKTTLKTGAERKLEGKDRDMLIAKRVIGSNEKFKTLLLDAGLPENKIPMKVSPAFIKKSPEEKALVVGEDKWTYAFAKDDLDFTSLPDRVWSIFGYDQEDASDVIRATTRSAQLQELVDARIAVKSTTNITRAERFMEAGKDGMLLPVGYAYYRAHTGRWGGNNKMNMQNLKRGGELRLAILAAPGHKLAVVDSGQIEARVNAWLWGEKDLLEAFRTGRDIYSEFASDSVYHRTITKADKTERHVGKTSILGLGFQMGAEKFQMTLAKGALGGPKVVFTLSAARAIVNAYRSKYYMIAGGWKLCAQMIEDMACGVSGWHKCIRWSGDGDGGGIIELPNGLSLKYPDLRKSRGDRGWDEWSYQSGDVRKKIYGGLLCENLVQALARIVVADQMVAIDKKYPVVMTTHDECVAHPKAAHAEKCFDYMMKCMTTAPHWCADMPLAAEGGFDDNYSK